MSLTPQQYLAACSATQAAEVIPALGESYAGGSAATIAGLLMMAVQDLATLAVREAAEAGRLAGIFADAQAAGLEASGETFADHRQQLSALHAAAERDDSAAAKALAIRILDHYVLTAEAAALVLPAAA